LDGDVPTTDPAAQNGWTIIVPVKDLGQAKSRLESTAGNRDRLALAFASDVVTAALGSPAVDSVIVVTADAHAAEILGGLGADIVPDPGGGLNAALTAAERTAGVTCAALAGDLPAVRSVDLTEALTQARAHRRAFMADAAGTGTTLLTRTGGAPLDPHFGPRSRAAHRVSGAVELDLGPRAPGLRRDVDTDIDLWDAQRLGVGLHTTRLLADEDSSARSRG
jgi:2-phospho-L-lactate guanylyltransferase